MQYITGSIKKITDTAALCFLHTIKIYSNRNALFELQNSFCRIIITAWPMDANFELCDLCRVNCKLCTCIASTGCMRSIMRSCGMKRRRSNDDTVPPPATRLSRMDSYS